MSETLAHSWSSNGGGSTTLHLEPGSYTVTASCPDPTFTVCVSEFSDNLCIGGLKPWPKLTAENFETIEHRGKAEFTIIVAGNFVVSYGELAKTLELWFEPAPAEASARNG